MSNSKTTVEKNTVKKETTNTKEPVKTKEDVSKEPKQQIDELGADKVSGSTKATSEKTEESNGAEASSKSDIGNEETSNEVELQVAQEDLDNNPELVNAGVEVEETVLILSPKIPSFVIPYLSAGAIGDELKYAVRSIAHSFPNATIIVVGDKEDWFSEKIVHIEHKVESDNPQVDVAQKLLLAITSGAVPEEFILTNDDIFLLGKTTIEDIQFLKAFGKLDNGVGKPGGIYNENAIRTLKALQKAGLGNIRYATHTPVMLNADALLHIINDLDADKEGHLLTSLYFNAFARDARPVQVDGGLNDPILVSVYRKTPNIEVVEKALVERKFMNTNDAGWPAVKSYIEKMYPEKSIFEA